MVFADPEARRSRFAVGAFIPVAPDDDRMFAMQSTQQDQDAHGAEEPWPGHA